MLALVLDVTRLGAVPSRYVGGQEAVKKSGLARAGHGQLAWNQQAFPLARACPSIFSRLPERELRTATCTGVPFAGAAFREELDRRLGLPRAAEPTRPPQVQERERQPFDRAKLLRYWGLNSDHGKALQVL